MNGYFAIPLGQVFTFEAEFIALLWLLILLGSMSGIGYSLRVTLLICFSCSLLTLSRFLGRFVKPTLESSVTSLYLLDFVDGFSGVLYF